MRISSKHLASPEQGENNKLTATSDLFSPGLILYEIATRKKAFDADNNKKMKAKRIALFNFLLWRMEHKKDFPTMPHQVVEISQKAKASGDTSAAEAVNLIPGWCRKNYAKKFLLVYPFAVKNIPVGLLYIDYIFPITAADENHLEPVKTLRNQVVLAICQA